MDDARMLSNFLARMPQSKSSYLDSISFAEEVANSLCERAVVLKNSHPSVTIGREERLIASLMEVVAALKSLVSTSNDLDLIETMSVEEQNEPDCALGGAGDMNNNFQTQTNCDEKRNRFSENFSNLRKTCRFTYVGSSGLEHRLRWSVIRKRFQALEKEVRQSRVGKRIKGSVQDCGVINKIRSTFSSSC